jgi:phenylacetate 2-hydroxylase
MELQAICLVGLTVGFFLIKYFNRTDIPKIKNIPEIPGIPLFGNLIQLGGEHAKKG